MVQFICTILRQQNPYLNLTVKIGLRQFLIKNPHAGADWNLEAKCFSPCTLPIWTTQIKVLIFQKNLIKPPLQAIFTNYLILNVRVVWNLLGSNSFSLHVTHTQGTRQTSVFNFPQIQYGCITSDNYGQFATQMLKYLRCSESNSWIFFIFSAFYPY